MKFASKQERNFLLRKALYLRYGLDTDTKKKEELGPSIMPISLIAKLLKLPE